ncbi:uncharacterized protein LOC112567853 [Pomacea canaliculata]|uniref:uncharacterized protein LOC112567853 n=1 Tax=Pomacea canaliculata TaxID=400727 RepID=UPI000D729D46|nr:uncharacterized protein LOC112567853 [Pomacea canaliculata]
MGYVTEFPFWSQFLFFTACVQGERSTCVLSSTETCAQKITFKIQGPLAEEGRSFKLINNFVGRKETVAVIGFVGFYICDPAAGYQCETHDKRTFFVTTPCQPGGNFALLADGELLTPCIASSEKEPFESDPDTLNQDDCGSDKTVIADDSNKRIDKRSVGKKCKQESSSVDANTENIVTGQAIGIILGIGLPALAVFVVVGFLYRRRRQQNTRKFVKRPDDIEAAGKPEDETRKCLSVENEQMDSQQAAEGEN